MLCLQSAGRALKGSEMLYFIKAFLKSQIKHEVKFCLKFGVVLEELALFLW